DPRHARARPRIRRRRVCLEQARGRHYPRDHGTARGVLRTRARGFALHPRRPAQECAYDVVFGLRLSTTSFTPSVAMAICLARSRIACESTAPVSVTVASWVATLMSDD